MHMKTANAVLNKFLRLYYTQCGNYCNLFATNCNQNINARGAFGPPGIVYISGGAIPLTLIFTPIVQPEA